MGVEDTSKITLVLGRISAVSISETTAIAGEKLYAISAGFWRSRAAEALSDLQRRRRDGEELASALAAALAGTAANISLVVESPLGLTVATAWCSHGLWWYRQAGGPLLFSDEEQLLAAAAGQLALDPRRVLRYLHDDANLSPRHSLFEGLQRIPGGCQASFRLGEEQAPELTALPLVRTPGSASTMRRALAEALDATAAEIVQQAQGGLICAQISGGIDGLVILASLVRQGARVQAIYGDDGSEQHAINQQVVDTLQRRFPAAELSYRWVRRGSIDAQALERAQEARCSHLIKGNYLKRNYKLALADAGTEGNREAPVCVVNGYGIDELYSGAKGDASLSTIHPLNAGLVLARVLSNWRTSAAGWHWLRWRLRLGRLRGASAGSLRRLLTRHLVGAGKAGGSLGLCAQEQIRSGFEQALLDDGEALSDLLAPLLPADPSAAELAAWCKRFIYGFVEQTHLVRFAAHGQAAGRVVVLPFEAGRVRQVLEAWMPCTSELWNPKQALAHYLQTMGVDYNAVTRAVCGGGSGRSKQLRVATGQLKAWLRRAVGPWLASAKPRGATRSDPSLDRALWQIGRHHPRGPGLNPLLAELRTISGERYVEAIETAIEQGQAAAGEFTTKQIYNYAHLVRYVLATRRQKQAC